MKTKTAFIIGGLALLVGLILSGLFVRYYGDWLWFQEMDYGSVFITILYTKVLVFLIFFAIFAVFAWVNIAIARKFGYSTRSTGLVNLNQSIQSLGFPLNDIYIKYAWGIIILFLALIMGYSAVGSWEMFLKFIHASSFGIADPIFSKDTGFYVFKLPLYNFIQTWYSYAIVLIFIGVGLSYFFAYPSKGQISPLDSGCIIFSGHRLVIPPETIQPLILYSRGCLWRRLCRCSRSNCNLLDPDSSDSHCYNYVLL